MAYTIPERVVTFHEIYADVIETAPATVVTVPPMTTEETVVQISIPEQTTVIFDRFGNSQDVVFLGTTVEVTPALDQIASATIGETVAMTVPARVQKDIQGHQFTMDKFVTSVPFVPVAPAVTITADAFTTTYVDAEHGITTEHVIPETTMVINRPQAQQVYKPFAPAYSESELLEVPYIPQPTQHEVAPVPQRFVPAYVEDDDVEAFVTIVPAHLETIMPDSGMVGFVEEESVTVIYDEHAAEHGGPITAIIPERVQTIQVVSILGHVTRTVPASTFTLQNRPSVVPQLPAQVTITTNLPRQVQTIAPAKAFNPAVVYTFPREEAVFTINRDVIQSAQRHDVTVITTTLAPRITPVRMIGNAPAHDRHIPARTAAINLPDVTPSYDITPPMIQIEMPPLMPSPVRTPPGFTPSPTRAASRVHYKRPAADSANHVVDQSINGPVRPGKQQLYNLANKLRVASTVRTSPTVPTAIPQVAVAVKDVVPQRVSSFLTHLISLFNGTVPAAAAPISLPAPLPQNVAIPPLITEIFSHFRALFNGTSIPTTNVAEIIDSYFTSPAFNQTLLGSFSNSTFFEMASNATGFGLNYTAPLLKSFNETAAGFAKPERQILTPLPMDEDEEDADEELTDFDDFVVDFLEDDDDDDEFVGFKLKKRDLHITETTSAAGLKMMPSATLLVGAVLVGVMKVLLL